MSLKSLEVFSQQTQQHTLKHHKAFLSLLISQGCCALVDEGVEAFWSEQTPLSLPQKSGCG